MNISEQAKNYIEKAMADNNVNTLRFFGVAGCCGVNLGLALQEAEEHDEVVQINGLNVAIHPDVKDQLHGVTLNVEGKDGDVGLVLDGYNPNACC